jgi:hypothetical protein
MYAYWVFTNYIHVIYIYMCTTYTIYTYCILHTNILKYMYFMIMHISIIICIYIYYAHPVHISFYGIYSRAKTTCVDDDVLHAQMVVSQWLGAGGSPSHHGLKHAKLI